MFSKQEEGGLFSDGKFDCPREIAEILVNDYPHAQRAIISLEVLAKTRSRRAVYELRDSLTHLAIAARPGLSNAEARRHLSECRTHFRRAAVEPFEYVAETQFLKIEKIAVRCNWVYTILCLPKPDGIQIIKELREIHDEIIAGRLGKATGESVQHMEKAARMATDLFDRIKPKQFYDRLYSVALLVVGAVGGQVLGIIFRRIFG